MTAYVVPSSFQISDCEFYLDPNERHMESGYTRSYQGIDLLGERFCMSFTVSPRPRESVGAVSGYFNKMRGGNTMVAWNYQTSGAPVGTMRGTPVLSASVAQGAATLLITTTAAATLKVGDMIGAGTQLFQVAEDAVANGSGAMTVFLANRVRVALAISVPVVWSRPTSEWRLVSPKVPILVVPGVMNAVHVDLYQTWIPGQ